MIALSETAMIDRVQALRAELEQIHGERIARIDRELKELQLQAYSRARIPAPGEHELIKPIIAAAARMFDVTPAEICGPCRLQKLTRARFAVMWTARKVHGLSSSELGRDLGQRAHTSVTHALNRADRWRRADPDYRQSLDELVAMFTPRSARAEFFQEEAENAASRH